MEALLLRAGRANCMSNIQQDMIEQTLAILASMMQQAAHEEPHTCSSSQSAPYLPHQVRIGMAILRLVGGACAQHARGA